MGSEQCRRLEPCSTSLMRDAAHGASKLQSTVLSASPKVLELRLTTLRGSGRWGCRLLDSLVDDSGGHTMLERRFLELVREANLPRPRTQVIHRKDGRHIARVDFLFEEFNVVVEVSGQLGHSTPSERARDAQRRNELQDLGRKVFEYTWEDVTQQPATKEPCVHACSAIAQRPNSRLRRVLRAAQNQKPDANVVFPTGVSRRGSPTRARHSRHRGVRSAPSDRVS